MASADGSRLGPCLSALLLAVLYGYCASVFGWFPSALLDRALGQAERILSPPAFVAPRVHERRGVRIPVPEEVQPGLTLIASAWREREWRWGLRLIDSSGHVLHEWEAEPGDLFPDSANRKGGGTTRAAIHGSHLLPNGDVIVNFNYVGTVRLDACSRVLWSLPAGSHHSVEPADDGTFWIPGSEHRRTVPADSDRFPGLVRPVYHDVLLKVSREGEIEATVNVLDLVYENDLERYVAKYFNTQREDVTHLNDIEPLGSSLAGEYPMFESGDVLLSLLHLDLVLVADPRSGRVKWHATDPFNRQHDPDFIGDGWIGIFDNRRDYTERGTMLGGSRVVALRPGSDSVEVLYPTGRSEPFYTEMMGKWQKLGNGNVLLTESRAGRVVEVAPDGRTVWEWIAEPYDEDHVPEVSEGTRYGIPRERVAAWPCSPKDRSSR